MSKNDLWIGAYYPDSVLPETRARTIMCLLFDKVICHFPVADMDCGGGIGCSEFFRNLLVDEDVIELREEFLLSDIEMNFSKGHYWGTPEEFKKYYEMQVTKMTLNLCKEENIVPITDDINIEIPASLFDRNKLFRFAHLQAAALAIQSLEITLPNFTDISDEDILEARLKLKDQLIPFRRAMLMMAPIVRNGINNDATMSDVYNEAKYIAETRIAPALNELKDKVDKERGRFWKKLLVKGGIALPKLAFNWVTKGAFAASLIGIDDLKDIALDTIDRKGIIDTLINHGGIGFLLKVSEYPKFKEINIT